MLPALALGLLAATAQVSILDAPDTLVASDSFSDPAYPFSVQVEITNTGDGSTTYTLNSLWDPTRPQYACPSSGADLQRSTPTYSNPDTTRSGPKRFQMDAGETRVFGGLVQETHSSGPAAVWQLAVFGEYRDNVGGGTTQVQEAFHDLCIVVQADDADCPFPCIAGTAPWRAWVRLDNAPPELTDIYVPEEAPPLAQVTLRALASDADTEPAPDPVEVTWDLGDGTVLVGETVQHAWSRTGEHVVTITASDGFDRTTAERTITVREGAEVPPPPPPIEAQGDPIPLGGPWLVLGILGAATVLRRRV